MSPSGGQAWPHAGWAGPGPSGPPRGGASLLCLSQPRGLCDRAKLQQQTDVSSKHDLPAKHWSGKKLSIYNFLPISPPPCVPGLRPVSFWTRRAQALAESPGPRRPPVWAPRQSTGTVFAGGCLPSRHGRGDCSDPAVRSLRAWNHCSSLFHEQHGCRADVVGQMWCQTREYCGCRPPGRQRGGGSARSRGGQEG